jgi:hypothetical protein
MFHQHYFYSDQNPNLIIVKKDNYANKKKYNTENANKTAKNQRVQMMPVILRMNRKKMMKKRLQQKRKGRNERKQPDQHLLKINKLYQELLTKNKQLNQRKN